MPPREPLAVRQTGRDWDIAIMGEGYFSLMPANTGILLFTRRGRFVLDENQAVILDTGATSHEDQLMLDPMISIGTEATDVRISTTGLVEGWLPRTNCWEAFGKIQISRFPNPAGLREVAPGIFATTSASGLFSSMEFTEDGGDVIKQGWLDASESATTSLAPSRVVYSAIAALCGAAIWMFAGARRGSPAASRVI